MIIGEYFNGKVPRGKGYFGYWVKIRKNGVNYYKIGTSTHVTQRFRAQDYKECTSIEVLYVAKFDNEYEMMNFEELNKSYLREQLLHNNIKGMKWIANDRFTYNKKRTQLPIMFQFGALKFLKVN